MSRAKQRARAVVGKAIRGAEAFLPLQHELTVAAVFRDEAPFLREWLSFHLAVGATRFLLYNNFSTDDYRDVLQPFVESGTVTLIEWPVPVGQLSAYRDAVRRCRYNSRWLALIDVDEFLFSPSSLDIRPVLDRFRDLPGLEVWSLFFGSNGHATRPATPVTDAYTSRAPLTETTVKSIVNPRQVYRVGIHQSRYWLGRGLDTSRSAVGFPHQPKLDVLRINHYWSRSLQDLATKVGRGDASTAQPRDADWHRQFEATLNQEQDHAILPIARLAREKSRDT